MPGVLVADEFGVGKSFTLGAAAMICQLQTVKVAMGLPQLILWGNTFEERLVIAQNDYTKFFGKEQKWDLLQRLNSLPRHLFEIL